MIPFLTSFYDKHLRKEKFTALGSSTFFFVDKNDKKIMSITATFIIGTKGTHDIKLEYVKDFNHLNPKAHGWYHTYCIPWVNKTGWANSEDIDHLVACINQICYNKEYDYEPQKKKVTAKKKSGETNVLEFPKREKE